MTEAVKKNGVTFGVILGIVSVLITAGIYATDVTNFVNWMLGIGIFVISLTILIIAVAKAKKAQEGYITFKEAFTTYFIAAAIGAGIATLFNIILFNVIDPAAKEIVTEETINMSVEWMQKAGSSSDDIRKIVEEARKTDSFGTVSLIKNYFFGLLFHIIVGLIVAAAFKKNKPEFV